MKKCICFSFCLLIFWGCVQSPAGHNTKSTLTAFTTATSNLPPIIIDAIPTRVKAGKPIILTAGNPKTTSLANNIIPAQSPATVSPLSVIVNTPGKAPFSAPTTKPVLITTHPVAIPEPVIAREPKVNDANPENFVSYGMLQGLRSNEFLSAFQDHNGNLWFGSNGYGISKFDGKNFTNYGTKEGLNQTFVSDMIEDRQGNIWFCSGNGGLSKFDGKSFSCFSTGGFLKSRWIPSLAADTAGNIWIGTNEDGLLKFDGKTFTHFTEKQGLIDKSILDLRIDKKGCLWISTPGGLSKYDGNSFYHYLFPGKAKNGTGRLFEDDKGNIWIGTNNSGVYMFDKNQFVHYTTQQGLPGNSITSISQDRKGNLWFGTPGSGVIKYDGKYFIPYSEKQGFNKYYVNGIVEDNSGNIWFATLGGGIVKWNSNNFSHLTSKEGLASNAIRHILKDSKGNLWLAGQENGVDRFDGKSFSNFSQKTGLVDPSVWSMMEDRNNNIWFGTMRGVSKYDGKSFYNYTEEQGLVNNIAISMCNTRNGEIWIGTVAGITRYDGDYFTNYSDQIGSGTDFAGCTFIVEDSRGNIWIPAHKGGVIKFDGSHFTKYTAQHGLSSNVVNCIVEDEEGAYWFGTDNGITKYDGKTFTQFSESNGLGNNNITTGTLDSYGNLWFGGPAGLSKLSREKRVLIAEAKLTPLSARHLFYNYGYTEGFTGVGVHCGNTICEGKINTIWVGAEDRLSYFNPLAESIDTTPPNMQLTGLKLFETKIPWQNLSSIRDSNLILSNGIVVKDYSFDSITAWYGLPAALSLAHNNNYVSFEFVGIDLNSPGKIKYQYKLEGLDQNWSPVAAKTEASYASLPAGNFTFRVKAVNADGYWSKEYNYPFIIRNAWWKTSWFVIASLLLILSTVYMVIRQRIAQKFRRSLERERQQNQIATYERNAIELEMQALRAQMNPHFFFNCLNSINMFLLENHKQLATEYLSKFSRLVRLILQNSLEAQIPLSRELEALQLYLELESLRFDNGFDYSINVDESIDSNGISVPPLIIQPFAENAIWHGLMHKHDKGILNISLSKEGDLLIYKVEDNGIGRSKADELKSKSALQHKSMGMRITKDRISLLKRKGSGPAVTVTDLVDASNQPAGTEVLIKIPIANV